MATAVRPTRRQTAIRVRAKRGPPLPGPGWRMPHVPGVLYLSRRRAAQLVEQEARKNFGMSAEEFARRYRAGEIDDPCRSEVVMLSMLLPWIER